jgi:Na+-transporting methylmalonyl-CoA/oxaloacetate decarboxylase gamma subunit
MLYSVLHGDLAAAVKFNALALVALVLLVLAFAVWTYGRVVGRQIWSWQQYRWSAAVTMVLVSVWFVVRNLPFAPFTGLYV